MGGPHQLPVAAGALRYARPAQLPPREDPPQPAAATRPPPIPQPPIPPHRPGCGQGTSSPHAHPRHDRPRRAVALAEHAAAALLPLPGAAYDVPVLAKVKVHRDFHVEVAFSTSWAARCGSSSTRPQAGGGPALAIARPVYRRHGHTGRHLPPRGLRPYGLRGEAHHPGSLPGRRQEGRDRGRSHGDGRRRHPDWLLGQDRRQDPVLAATVLSTFCVSSDLCHLGKIAGLLRR